MHILRRMSAGCHLACLQVGGAVGYADGASLGFDEGSWEQPKSFVQASSQTELSSLPGLNASLLQ